MDYRRVADMLLNSTSDVLQLRSVNPPRLNDAQYARHILKTLFSFSNYLWPLFVLAFPFLLNYVYAGLAPHSVLDRKGYKRQPPTAPHDILGLGHSLSFAWDMRGFLTSVR